MHLSGIAGLTGREKGQVLPTVTLIVIVLLGMAALGADLFLVYWNKERLQQAGDAAALAGATYLSDTTFSEANSSCAYSTPAQQAACTLALANGVLASEIQSITVAGSGTSITVVISRRVSAAFARLLGFSQFTVQSQSVGAIGAAGKVYNIIPIGLDAGTPYTYGDAIVMHNGGCGSGCWGAIDYAGSSGGNALSSQLANGCSCTVTVGSTYTVGSFTGAKTGPVDQGIAQRISDGQSTDASGTWQSHSLTDPRVAVVGLVNWGSGNGANQTATVTGFAAVWLTGSTQANIDATFISQVVPSASGTGTINAGAMRALLTQ